ncbi:hypothetical protein C8R43DRAFT_1130763 [Mycena crocata]|nr:hypothetical protein C8R43DRAFT_1130763 [Mycena crocata]
MFFSALILVSASVASVNAAASFPEGVIATGTQGTTNPPVPTTGTKVDQGSMARLLSVNSIDDFCLFAPPTVAPVADTETIEVAWCTKPRNNARLIPDGTLTGVTFLKTDFYVQVMGTGDFTKLNIAAGDDGGELDPHGQFGTGNPEGGNVTTVIDNVDQPIAEWMLYISANQFCLRACTNANSTYSAAFMCWHELDVMGCEFVMPGTYKPPGTFETCDADVAYPPGWYPTVVDGTTSFSTFAQFFTGVFTGGDGNTTPFTVGDTVTPSAPFSIPSSSNCVTTSTVANGVDVNLLITGASGAAGASATPTASGGSAAGAGSGTSKKATTTPTAGAGSGAAGGSQTGSGSQASGTGAALRSANIGGGEFVAITLVSLISVLAAVGLLH